MKKLYIGTNTKMYQGIAQTVAFLNELGALTKDIDRAEVELFVIPSYTALDAAGRAAQAQGIRLGAQNVAWEDEGQFTGEISAPMLLEVGAGIAEIGHSERRHILGETNDMENRKVHAALRHSMTALLCIGETKEQKLRGIANEILRIQLKEGLFEVCPKAAKDRLWIAYEPVWAIGLDGEPASATYAEEKHRVIRETLCELLGETVGNAVPILYGGSVNAQNAEALIVRPHIDGLFIGRSAWKAESFAAIIRTVLPLFQQK